MSQQEASLQAWEIWRFGWIGTWVAWFTMVERVAFTSSSDDLDVIT